MKDLFNLSTLYRYLYKKKYYGLPILCDEIRYDSYRKDIFPSFFHRHANYRFIPVAWRGCIQFSDILCSEANIQVISVKNRKDFLKLHLYPLSKSLLSRIEQYQDDDTFTDFMGRSTRDKSSGSTIRSCLLELLMTDTKGLLQQLVTTQVTILSKYAYSPVMLRLMLTDFFHNVKENENPDKRLIKFGYIDYIYETTMNQLSSGNDATALAYLLLVTALQEFPNDFVFPHSIQLFPKLVWIEDTYHSTEVKNIDNTYHLEYDSYSFNTFSNLRLYKDEQCIMIYTDSIGYFFTPISFDKGIENFSPLSEGIHYAMRFHVFLEGGIATNDYFMFEWMIQPDGRYYEDEDGFGAEDQEERILYALVDKESGQFVTPFSTSNQLSYLLSIRYSDSNNIFNVHNTYYPKYIKFKVEQSFLFQENHYFDLPQD